MKTLSDRLIDFKSLIILLLFVFVVVSFTFTPITYFPLFNREFIGYAIGVIASVFGAWRFVNDKRFVCVISYAIILLFNYYFEPHVNLGNILSESFTLICVAFMTYFVFSNKSKLYNVIIIYFYLFILLFYTVQSFRLNQGFSGIMRYAAMPSHRSEAAAFFARGLSPYDFPHALTCIIPVFVFGIRNRSLEKWKRIVALVCLSLSIVLIYISQASGALLVGIFALLCSLLAKTGPVNQSIRKIIVVSILMFPLLVSTDLQLGVISWAKNGVGTSSHYYFKLEELEGSIKGTDDEGDISYRGDLLVSTLESIGRHPIMGSKEDDYGHHNAWLDRWAEYGFIGLLPILVFFFLQIKAVKRFIVEDIRIFYYIGASSCFLMMLTKSMFGWHQWFAFSIMLPLLLIFFNTQNNNSISDELIS